MASEPQIWPLGLLSDLLDLDQATEPQNQASVPQNHSSASETCYEISSKGGDGWTDEGFGSEARCRARRLDEGLWGRM